MVSLSQYTGSIFMMRNKEFVSRFFGIIVLAACIVCSGCTSTGSQTSVQSDSLTATATPTQIPVSQNTLETTVTTPATLAPTPAQTTLVTATGTTVSNPVIVTVNSAMKKTTLGTYNPKSGAVFIIVDITIRNNDKNEDFDYTEASFSLFDKTNQQKYSPITSKVGGSVNNPLTSGTVPLKSEITGQVVFGIKDTSSTSYVFTVADSTGSVLASFDPVTVS